MEQKITVLIVDDEPVGREALEGVLFSQGYHLISAENGQEAYQKALAFTPDLILLDVMMPNMDGFEFCRKLRSDPLLSEMPVIMVTALDDRASRLKGIDAGADDFISKPFDRLELRARVKTVTRLNRYRTLLLERTRFVWVVEQAKEGYLILGPDQRIRFANPAAQNFLSLPMTIEQDPGEPFQAWAGKQYQFEPIESWKAWADGTFPEQPLYLIRPENRQSTAFWLQVEILDLPWGNKTSTLIRLSDITDRVLMNQEMWTFNSMIAHKLRTPMSNMFLSADLIHLRATQAKNPELLELGDIVKEGVQRLRDSVEDILKYVYAPALAKSGGCIALSSLEASLQQIAADLGLEPVQFQAGDLEPGLVARISHNSMEIVLWEVLENARKFHPSLSPRVEVDLSRVSAGTVLLRIQDDGVHLSPQILNQAWTPYYQGEKDFTGEVQGMGLGLSTAASLIWSAGGKYRLVNRVDRPGVVVELVLPVEMEGDE